jgi:gas vesicle protein
MSEENGNSFLWFLAGLGVGAVVGVLYAPKSGKETRDEIVNRFGESREFVKQKADEARQQAGEWVNRGREVLDERKEQFRSAYEAGKKAYQDATTSEPGPQKI